MIHVHDTLQGQVLSVEDSNAKMCVVLVGAAVTRAATRTTGTRTIAVLVVAQEFQLTSQGAGTEFHIISTSFADEHVLHMHTRTHF